MNESTLYNVIRYKYRNGKEDVSFIFQFDHLDRFTLSTKILKNKDAFQDFQKIVKISNSFEFK